MDNATVGAEKRVYSLPPPYPGITLEISELVPSLLQSFFDMKGPGAQIQCPTLNKTPEKGGLPQEP